jgi:hypothetical protein
VTGVGSPLEPDDEQARAKKEAPRHNSEKLKFFMVSISCITHTDLFEVGAEDMCVVSVSQGDVEAVSF